MCIFVYSQWCKAVCSFLEKFMFLQMLKPLHNVQNQMDNKSSVSVLYSSQIGSGKTVTVYMEKSTCVSYCIMWVYMWSSIWFQLSVSVFPLFMLYLSTLAPLMEWNDLIMCFSFHLHPLENMKDHIVFVLLCSVEWLMQILCKKALYWSLHMPYNINLKRDGWKLDWFWEQYNH